MARLYACRITYGLWLRCPSLSLREPPAPKAWRQLRVGVEVRHQRPGGRRAAKADGGAVEPDELVEGPEMNRNPEAIVFGIYPHYGPYSNYGTAILKTCYLAYIPVGGLFCLLLHMLGDTSH